MKWKYPLLRWRYTMRYCVEHCAGLFTVYSWRTVAALCQLQSCVNFGDKLWPIAPNSAALWAVFRLKRIKQYLTPIPSHGNVCMAQVGRGCYDQLKYWTICRNVCMSTCITTVHWWPGDMWPMCDPVCPSATLLVIANNAASLLTSHPRSTLD